MMRSRMTHMSVAPMAYAIPVSAQERISSFLIDKTTMPQTMRAVPKARTGVSCSPSSKTASVLEKRGPRPRRMPEGAAPMRWTPAN